MSLRYKIRVFFLRNDVKHLFYYFLFFVGIYIYINVEVFMWYIIDPTGFWGILWFTILSSTLFTIFVFVTDAIPLILMDKKKGNMNIITAIVILSLYILSGLLYYGPTIFISKRLYDKYKYIKRSERFISEGKYDKAIQYAQKVYNNTINTKSPSKILILPHLYYNTEKAIKTRKAKEYSSITNLAFCLHALGANIERSESYYKQSISIANEYLFKNPDLLVFPYIELAKINTEQGKAKIAEEYFEKLLDLTGSLENDDIMYYVMALYNYAFYYENHGQIEEAMKLREKALDIYKDSNRSEKSIFYLQLLLNVLNDRLATGDINSVEPLYDTTVKLAKKHKHKQVYLLFLITKTKVLLEDYKHGKDCKYLQKNIMYQANRILSKKQNCKEYIFKEIEKTLNSLLKETKKRESIHSPNYARTLFFIGNFYYQNGYSEKATEFFNEALKIFKAYKNADPESYYLILLSSLYPDFNKTQEIRSLRILRESGNYYIERTNETFPFLTENERESYMFLISKTFSNINALYRVLNDSSSCSALYNNTLSIKSIALHSNQYLKISASR